MLGRDCVRGLRRCGARPDRQPERGSGIAGAGGTNTWFAPSVFSLHSDEQDILEQAPGKMKTAESPGDGEGLDQRGHKLSAGRLNAARQTLRSSSDGCLQCLGKPVLR